MLYGLVSPQFPAHPHSCNRPSQDLYHINKTVPPQAFAVTLIVTCAVMTVIMMIVMVSICPHFAMTIIMLVAMVSHLA